MTLRPVLTRSSTTSAVRRARAGGAVDVLLAASLWGTTGTVRTFAPDGASSVSVAALRMVLGGLMLAGVVLVTARGDLARLLRAPRAVPMLAAGAAAMIVYQTAFFVAAGRTGVAVATVVTIGASPAFTGLIGVLTRRSRVDGRWLLATAGAVAGCAALVLGGRGSGVEPVGIGLALLSGLGYATYATLSSVLITRGERDRCVVAGLFGLSGLASLPVLLLGSPGWVVTGSGPAVALWLGPVATGGAYLLFARGLRTTPATTATTLTLAEPAVASVLGVAVLGEHLGTVALGGLGFLAASLVVLVVPARRQEGGKDRPGR
ncbi:EamA family transporter [Actinomadura logoneensis]|uniref:EamA family transporter n=1 Tax=Actinomadura logoneensis TaxID=2293572 RepID=A0A372JFU5_9ACTN|nr:EamA family transporter [Actinomadura logoneensis]RFU38724.1 EamA family transporter [Actinomadura logoneensis]